MLEIKETAPVEKNVFKALRLRHIVNGKVCSIRELSRRMNGEVAASHISELERNVMEPTKKSLKAYHKYFNVSYEILLGEKDFDSIPTNNSFDDILDTLAMSDLSSDKKMIRLFLSLGTTDTGLALLYYLSNYIYNEDNEEVDTNTLIKILKKLKEPRINKMDYQAIRQLIDSDGCL